MIPKVKKTKTKLHTSLYTGINYVNLYNKIIG